MGSGEKKWGHVLAVDHQPVTSLWVYLFSNVCRTFQTELHKLDMYVLLVLHKSLILGSSNQMKSIFILFERLSLRCHSEGSANQSPSIPPPGPLQHKFAL